MDSHIIKNLDSLATTPLREDALGILEAGLQAIRTDDALHRVVKLGGSTLTVGDRSYDLTQYERVLVLGIGKAALDAAAALEDILNDHITDGVIIDTRTKGLKYMQSLVGTHPLPSEQNIEATKEALALLQNTSKDDLVIIIVSGGGSTLLCQPYGISVQELADVTQSLMKKGAPIEEVNTVRKHLSSVHGGQLAEMAAPATVIGLIFSDIPTNDISLVASGPTFLDTSTVADAKAVLSRYGITLEEKSVSPFKETPKDPSLFSSVHNQIVVSNQLAAEAMLAAATSLKYNTRLYATDIQGEAREVGAMLANLPKENEVIIACGETTVTVTGNGQGGRNQELALSALLDIPESTLVISCASDGVDNNTPVAGAIADSEAKAQAQSLSLTPKDFLETNDSYSFFKKVGTTIDTGKTGTNVADLMIAIRRL